MTQTTLEQACVNTDKELWREKEGDYYSPSLFVTERGGIGINVGGYCIVMPIEKWHSIAKTSTSLRDAFTAWAVANG
jgi:hypothetical protein